MTYSPGIYADLTSEEYHADPALGSTSLKTLASRTPAHWQYEKANPVHKDIYDLGTVTHSLILEGDESGVEVIDVPDKRGAKWTVPAAEAVNAGKIPLKQAEWDLVRAMRDSVMEHPVAKTAFTGHRAEESVFWEDDGLMLKCRPDAWLKDRLVDLKTTVNADPREFPKSGFKLGYYQSAAHYQDGVLAMTGERLPFWFVNVEKTAPHLVSIVEYDDYAMELGRMMNARAKDIYRRCLETGEYPGYPTVEPITLPIWAIYQAEDILGLNIEKEIVIK
ncbi:PDDEXK-like protein of unknown function [Arthrobacter sp. yr096]|uniref:PD-(D/E)XK nuclease-like domain-containing protein n=1 Tax=Arthrobacter sp. yr096 TaxID=1761750 RepID=UPI0008C78CFE|nr:PD-(D/E)XK nuclease-like domain-containing protein [Arthrobacter sp. yr096]SEI45578.1 PDDEXK-like protein of unknown function [Arthrobacter sp. yr096]